MILQLDLNSTKMEWIEPKNERTFNLWGINFLSILFIGIQIFSLFPRKIGEADIFWSGHLSIYIDSFEPVYQLPCGQLYTAIKFIDIPIVVYTSLF